MMKGLFSKLKRKLGAVREEATHPDLEPQGQGVKQPSVISRADQEKHDGSVLAEPAFARQGSNDETLHPDLELIDPLIIEELPLKGLRGEPSAPADPAASKEGVSPAEADTGARAENEGKERKQPDPNAAPEAPTAHVPASANGLNTAEVDDEAEELAKEEDAVAKLPGEHREDRLNHEAIGEAGAGGAGAPRPGNLRASGYLPSTGEKAVEGEAEHDSWERQKSNPDAVSAAPTPDVPVSADVLDAGEPDYEEDVFAQEEDDFAELEEQFWAAEFAFEVGGKADYDAFDDAPLDDANFDELPELDPYKTHDDAESAQWEELLDLELYEDGAELSAPRIEDEQSSGGRQLDGYAARLVSQMPVIKLDERSLLQRRFKAILEEFPFFTSYKALSSLVSAGVSLEELEEACELKCLWREAPWLWSHRLRNRLLGGAWETQERSTYRNALSWRLAITLIGSVGRPEAERKLFEDWLTEWQQMSIEHAGLGARMDPSFWSYSAYLQLKRERVSLINDDLWFYEELTDRQLWNSIRLEDSQGEAWRFEPKTDRRDTGFLSTLPSPQRMAGQEQAESSKAEKQEKKADE